MARETRPTADYYLILKRLTRPLSRNLKKRVGGSESFQEAGQRRP
ncbi:hypothetical protein [Marivirga lumbricoides]